MCVPSWGLSREDGVDDNQLNREIGGECGWTDVILVKYCSDTKIFQQAEDTITRSRAISAQFAKQTSRQLNHFPNQLQIVTLMEVCGCTDSGYYCDCIHKVHDNWLLTYIWLDISRFSWTEQDRSRPEKNLSGVEQKSPTQSKSNCTGFTKINDWL